MNLSIKNYAATLLFIISFALIGLVDGRHGSLKYALLGLSMLAPVAAIGFAFGNWRSAIKHSTLSALISGVLTYGCVQFTYRTLPIHGVPIMLTYCLFFSLLAGFYYAPIIKKIKS